MHRLRPLLVAQQTESPHDFSGQSSSNCSPRDCSQPGANGGVDILTDTQGVDFGPYLQDCLSKVRTNWYSLIPESDQLKKGRLAIEFSVLKDGDCQHETGQHCRRRVAGSRSRRDYLVCPFQRCPAHSTDPTSRSEFGSFTTRKRPAWRKTEARPNWPTRSCTRCCRRTSSTPAFLTIPERAKTRSKESSSSSANRSPRRSGKSTAARRKSDAGRGRRWAVRKWRFDAHIDAKPIEDQVRINVLFLVARRICASPDCPAGVASSSSLPR